MILQARYLETTLSLWMALQLSVFQEASCDPGVTAEYCLHESFQPRCMKNEVILMKSATYGRMRIGRCITSKGIEERGPEVLQDPRYLGCSLTVLDILDRKCSRKTQCEIRVIDMALENIVPTCYPDLMVYLEVNYECINVADEERSCSVSASVVPTHVIGSSDESHRICGRKQQPWIVEAPVGQKVNIRLIDFNASQSESVQTQEHIKQQRCHHYGVIVDKTSKRNVTICGDGVQREKELYTTTGSTAELFFNALSHKQLESENGIKQFLLKVTAVGCLDLIPPEDAWLKRSDDSIVIGCYSSRQTWHLHCEGEKWIGVFGNCSEGQVSDLLAESERKPKDWNKERVLAMVAVGGFTLTVCLVVLCVGIVCLRRVSFKGKENQDYKVVICNTTSSRHVNLAQQLPAGLVNDSEMHGS